MDDFFRKKGVTNALHSRFTRHLFGMIRIKKINFTVKIYLDLITIWQSTAINLWQVTSFEMLMPALNMHNWQLTKSRVTVIQLFCDELQIKARS